jgi:hypothetical protein
MGGHRTRVDSPEYACKTEAEVTEPVVNQVAQFQESCATRFSDHRKWNFPTMLRARNWQILSR